MSKAQLGTKVLSTRLPIELIDQINEKAEQLDRTRHGIVKEALTDWLWWEEEKHRRTLEALASIEAGRTIPQEEVDAYFDSLGTDNPLPKPVPK